ncbi:CapA family protein [Paenibacillus arenilitoris]|uniref:CapA family protein n=1 Tax=Paenibacillus arenilitoris TaxID=2772299 RepID=A0A927CHE0_9BACL|nr:CapA family protein [Paenibacillus arenilitoris]MBD2867549.1 CapA family protein [Paenibacillus arenilitoris]
MYLSRSETHQQDKLKRKKRLKRLMIVNLTLFGVIIAVLAVWLAGSMLRNAQEPSGGGGASGSEQSAGLAPEDEPAAPSAEPDADPGDPAEPGGEELEGGAESGEGVPPSEESGDGERVSLSFVGDLLLGEYVNKVVEQEGFDFLYRPSLLYLSESDLTAGNLEHPVTNGGTPAEGKDYVFKGSPDALPPLRNAGFDVVSLANNHTLDQGVEGLLDTMRHLEDAGIAHVGAGSNDTEAFAPVIKEAKGIKVAFIGLSRVVPSVEWKADKNVAGVAETYDTRRAVAAIKKAKEQADVVAVMVHWGKERVDRPEPYQRDFARQYIDAGADLVIGSHPHVLQGFETYKGKWIAYSLGNFIFSAFPKGTAGETGVLDALCTAGGDCELIFHPMFTVNAQPTPLEAEPAKALLERLTSISFGVRLGEDGKLIPG